MGVIRIYPKAHFCSFTRGTGWGTHTAAGTSVDSLSGDCSTYCDDLYGALDETDYAIARSSATTGQVNDGRFEWTFGDVPIGFTFGTLRLVAYCRTSNAGAAGIDSSPTVYMFVDPASGTRDYAGSGDTITKAVNRNTESAVGNYQVITQSWASKPGGGAWTRSELQSGAFKAGIESDSGGSGSGIDATTGGSSASFDVLDFYVEIDATPTGLFVEPVRTVLSHQLRLFGKALRVVTLDVPIRFGNVQPGDTVWCAHELLPWSPGYESWKQIPLYVTGVTDKLDPPSLTLNCLDLREVYCTFYSPLQVLGVDEQHTGLAKLDQGGGWTTLRNQATFCQRDGDLVWREVAANVAPIGKDGLQVNGGGDGITDEDAQYLLNSAYSQWASSTDCNDWTETVTGGGTIVQDTDVYFVDSPGWQASAKVGTAAGGESAYLSQQIAIGATGLNLYVRQWYRNDSGSDQHFIQIYRVVGGTGNYWNDSTAAWQAGAYNIQPTLTATGIGYFCSKQIPYGGSTGTLTIYTGHLAGLVTGANTLHLLNTEVMLGTQVLWRLRPPSPTTTAAVVRRWNLTYLDNTEDFRVWRPDRGHFRVDFEPYWSHADLIDGQDKAVVASSFDGAIGSEIHDCYYHRTDASNGYWYFAGVQVATSGGSLPAAGTVYTLAGRWTSEAEDELGLTGQAIDFWLDGVKAAGTTGGTEPVPTAAASVYLGYLPGPTALADGYLTNLVIDGRVPTDTEMARL